jgi:hypothetical protein
MCSCSTAACRKARSRPQRRCHSSSLLRFPSFFRRSVHQQRPAGPAYTHLLYAGHVRIHTYPYSPLPRVLASSLLTPSNETADEHSKLQAKHTRSRVPVAAGHCENENMA